jgi:hypothetical protein
VLISHLFATETPYYNFGIRAGFSTSSFASQRDNISVDPAISFSTSGYYSNIFYLNLGISYIVRSARLNNIRVITHDIENVTSIYKWDQNFTISYFQFSLRGGFYIFNNFSVLIGAGTSISSVKVSEEINNKEFLFNYDRTLHDWNQFYQEYTYEPTTPVIELSYNLGFRYDFERIYFEISYMRDIIHRRSLYSLGEINSYIGSIFFTIGYNIFYHIRK